MRRDYLLIIILALLFFFPFLGGIHLFDQEELNVAESAREMLLTGEWMYPQIDFQPFWDNPPMFVWAEAISMQIFGVNEFAARFPNAICGLVTLLLVYRIGYRLHDRIFGWLWVLAWAGSFLPHFYFRSGIIDPWFNLLIFGALYGFIEFRWQFLTNRCSSSAWIRYRYLIFGAGLLGMALLTKGLMAFLIVVLVLLLYWARYRFNGKGYLKHLLVLSGGAILMAFSWLLLEMWRLGPEYARQFLIHQLDVLNPSVSTKGGFFGYHALVLLLGCFPVSAFALSNLWGDGQSEDEMLESEPLAACKRSDLVTWMQLLFWAAFALYLFVPSTTVHFSSLSYFPLTYLGAVTIWRAIHWNIHPRAVAWLLPVIGILLGTFVMSMPWLGQHTEVLENWFEHYPFALAALKADVHWQYWQGLPGLILVASSVAGVFFWLKNRAWLAAQTVFAGGAVFAALFSVSIICNLEGYAQRAAIEFYEAKYGEACHIKPVGFTTYAHLFYTGKVQTKSATKTYFVARLPDLGDLPQRAGCRELYRKNGFVFFELTATAPEQDK